MVVDGGVGVTGLTPQVSIRRYKETNGALLDNWFWDTSISNPSYGGVGDFVATPVWYDMDEYDSANNPGQYVYLFEQASIGIEWTYMVFFKSTAGTLEMTSQMHIVTNDVRVPNIVPDPVVVGPQTVMGQLELVKGLLHHNSIIDNHTYAADGQLESARVRVFSLPSQVPDDPGGDETVGMLVEYNIEAEYDANGLNRRFVLKRTYP
jgi:hypothetical protein